MSRHRSTATLKMKKCFAVPFASKVTTAMNSSLHVKRYLLLDRDPLYTQAFRQILDQAGVKTVRLPAHSPNLNALAERFVLSIKSECLERLVPLGERHLRLASSEYLRHYHLERNHQGLANALIDSKSQDVAGGSAVACREGLGGLLKFYYREAAWSRRNISTRRRSFYERNH